ncbi:porin [Ferrimonas balearica]|uniref:porin n=1 Tax=Ferrimonas balearica TaxID=44012 RepID=UPI001C5734A2|nr:porin [Ferrimonas balearica]MBW3163992.1 porin [Ferrimonas balearica]
MSMKPTLIAAALSALTLPATATAADPLQMYGRLNLVLQANDIQGESETRVGSYSSRVGIKGSHQINESLEAFYQAEWGLNVTEGEETFTHRNQFIGLRGDFGTTTIGRRDTALKRSQGKVDQFNDFEGDFNKIMSGEVRASQQVSYATPRLADLFTAEVTYLADDGNKGEHGFSAALMAGDASYRKQPFYAAVAYDSEVAQRDVLRVTAGAKLAGIELGAIYSDEEVVAGELNGASGDAFMVSAGYQIGNGKIKAQYADGDVPARANTSYSVGGEYRLSKQMKVNAYYTTLEWDSKDEDDSYLGLGLQYDF